jgi:SAM-dependent methyltransferase
MEKLRASLDAATFVKLTLSQPAAAARASQLRNVYARLVALRDGSRLSCVWRYATRDVTKNFPPEDAVAQLAEMLGRDFERARLFTTAGDWEWRCDGSGEGLLRAARPAFATLPEPKHDRKKSRALPAGSSALRALGVADSHGKPRPGMSGKLRQIERFAELLGHLLDESRLRERREIRVLDMGAGKGYLTFAACELFRARGIAAEVIGVEMRGDLVETGNRLAQDASFAEVRFVRGAIGDFPIENCDVLIALHACNTATDDALHAGIRASAELILTAPCCHQEVRPQIVPPAVLRSVLRHGILLEREAEIITDALRALLLEMNGYRASVFEFIATEHTQRNLMIAAVRRAQPIDAAPLRAQLREAIEFYGIREQRLARLLGEL